MTEPLWQKVLVAAVGPAVAAVLALLVANRVTSRAQARREAGDLRESLAAEMDAIAGELYFTLQSFWRAASEVPLPQRATDPTLAADRERLEAAYLRARTTGQVLERRLGIYFRDDAPRRTWHRVMDLLSVRYFLLLLPEPDRRETIRERNAGPDHSGLTAEELEDPTRLLDAIRSAIPEAVAALWAHPIDRSGAPSASLDAGR